MTITVDVEGVGQLLRLDLDADKVRCVAPADQNDFDGRLLSRDAAGRLHAVPGFMVITRDGGRPVLIVDAFGGAPALWGKVTDDPSPLDLDVGRVEGLGDRLNKWERDDVDRLKRAPGATSPLRRMLAIVDRLAPPPPPPLPRAVVEAAERAALEKDLRIGPPVDARPDVAQTDPPSTGGLGGVPSPHCRQPPENA